MLKTPEHLTQQFHIAPDAGQGRAIPRILLAYRGSNKARFLKTSLAAIVAGVLPEYGQKRTWAREHTQSQLAGMCSTSRETFTRWLSEVATPDDSWDVSRRLQQRDRTVELHRRRGHKLHDRQRPSRAHISTLIVRRRRFMRANAYSSALPEPQQNRARNCWYPPTLEELARCERTAGLFRPAEDGEQGVRGFGYVPRWVWNQRLPLSSNARLVMSYYFMVGLLKPRKSGPIGVVRPRQATVATAMGISVHSVYNANRELAALSLIRVAHERTSHPDGSFTSSPQIIVYLPIRQLTSEEADFERKRLQFALFAATAPPAPWMAPRVKELHAALLSQWQCQEHSLRAFWNQLRKNAIAEGIHLNFINRLVPSPPE
jgi:hypothetical protein